MPGESLLLFEDRYSFRPEQQHWHSDAVLHAAGGCPQEQVAEKAVSVCAHSHQIASFLLDPFDNFFGRISVCQLGLS
jgi:hypothetical protein